MKIEQPRKEDEDAQGCVLVWHRLSGAMVYRADIAMQNDFITHWMKLPERPIMTDMLEDME